MKRLWCMLVAVCWLGLAMDARSQEIDPQARAAARTLVEDGDKLWDQGDFAGALDRFTRAHGLVNAPTVAIRQAECLEKLGRLVEASEKYVAISRLKLDPGAPDAFRRAVATALDRVEGLRERLGFLEVRIEGDDITGARVMVDGREISPALVGASFPVDPGDRVIEVVKGNRKVQETLTIQEKETRALVLTLPAAEPEPEPDVVPPSKEPEPPAPMVEPAVAMEAPSSQSTWGWVSLGVGAAGLAVGGTTGLLAISKRSSLDETCVDSKCPPSQQSDVDGYNQMRTISTIGFGVGVVGVGAGLTLLLTAPSSEPREHAGVRPWLGFGSAGVEGRF